MNRRRVLLILFIIFFTLSIGSSIYIELATRTNLVVNTSVDTAVQTEVQTQSEITKEDPLAEGLSLELNKAQIVSFQLLNRDLPVKWQSKNVRFKYTYIGEYSDSTLNRLNSLLKGEYRWQNQLDENGDILFGGPILLKDGVYQLFPHNGLYQTTRYYLFGDLLDWLNHKGTLEGTEMKIGDITFKCTWVKDTEMLQDSSAPRATLIISTCLERDGDRRLLSGWDIVTTQ